MIQTKLDLVFRLAVEHFVDLESLGLSWSSLEDPVRLQQAKELLLGAAVRLSLDRLRILLAAGQRWRTYAAAQCFDARKPSPIRMAEFLAMVAKGGPTAASSMWHALLWWSRSYGLEWPLEHFTCVSFKMHAPGHRTVQAIELEPWEFVNLASLMVQAKGTNQVILAWFMMTALSCVRYEHLQRSKLVRDHGDWLEFYALRERLGEKDRDLAIRGPARTSCGRATTWQSCWPTSSPTSLRTRGFCSRPWNFMPATCGRSMKAPQWLPPGS